MLKYGGLTLDQLPDPLVAVLGRIPLREPPCRVWQVGEGVSLALDASMNIGAMVESGNIKQPGHCWIRQCRDNAS